MSVVALLLVAVGCSSDGGSHPAGLDGASVVGSPAPPVAPADGVRAFDTPAVAADAPLVFAHYFPPYPISFDNLPADQDYYATHYLDPQGEEGRHAAYGGLLRDRPLPRPPLDDPDYRQRDLEEEVRQAKSAGISGFTVDVLVRRDDPDTTIASRPAALMAAAQSVDPSFAVMLMPDMSGTLADLSPQQLADEMAAFAASPAAFRLVDGRLVVSPFAAETKSPQWWGGFIDAMAREHAITVALVPLFVDSGVDLARYAPVSYGMSSWGARNPEFNPGQARGPASPVAQAQTAHALGKIWMAPVAVQDARPGQSVFDEAVGTENLRAMWENARTTGSEWVQLVTWNDYSEGTAFAPSIEHGWSFLDISAYWLYWYRTGSPPPIVRDTVYLTHRTQRVDAPTSLAAPMTVRPGGTEPVDIVEALTFSTTPGEVTVTVGGTVTSCQVPAGVGVCTAPLAPGEVSAVLRSGDSATTSVRSPAMVVANPVVQNLNYFSVSSRR